MPNKTAIITGATSGIGRATANLLHDKGWGLILTGRRMERLKDIKSKLNENDRIVDIHCFDIRSYNECAKFAARIEARFDHIDLLFNNAGLAQGLAPVNDGDISDWETMLDTNVKGLLYMTRLISPIMVKQGSGMVINTCSTAGKEVYPMGNVYCATKHAVDALTKAMRLDLYEHGIRVGQVSPGHVESTEFAEVRFHGNKQKADIYSDFNPLKAKDVAAAVAFMAEQPAHVNIQDILMMGTQQANSNYIDRSGRKYD